MRRGWWLSGAVALIGAASLAYAQISSLPNATTPLTGNETVAIDQAQGINMRTVKTTITNIRAGLPGIFPPNTVYANLDQATSKAPTPTVPVWTFPIPPMAVRDLAVFNTVDGKQLVSKGWHIDSLNHLNAGGPAQNLRLYGVYGGVQFHSDNNTGPFLTWDGADDTITAIAQLGPPDGFPGPSDTTNFQVNAPDGVNGGGALLNATHYSSLTPPREERLLLGWATYYNKWMLGNVLTGGAVCADLGVEWGNPAIEWFSITCGGGLTLSNNVPMHAFMPGQVNPQNIVYLNQQAELVIGDGADIDTIFLSKHVGIANDGVPIPQADCGAGATVNGGDSAGTVFFGSPGITQCTIQFGKVFHNTPIIVLTGIGTGAAVPSLLPFYTGAFFQISMTADSSTKAVNWIAISR